MISRKHCGIFSKRKNITYNIQHNIPYTIHVSIRESLIERDHLSLFLSLFFSNGDEETDNCKDKKEGEESVSRRMRTSLYNQYTGCAVKRRREKCTGGRGGGYANAKEDERRTSSGWEATVDAKASSHHSMVLSYFKR